MPSRSNRSAPPAQRARPNQVLVAIVLVAAGGIAALGFDRLGAGGASGTAGTAAVASPSAVADPLASGDVALASDIPVDAPWGSAAPSPSPVSPVLAAAMPRDISGTALTVETDLGSAILGGDPGSRSFTAAIATLGVVPDEMEVGYAYDEAGSLPLTVLGFRIPGVAATKLQPLVLEAWLSSTAPGVTSDTVTLSGTSTTRVSYGDEGSNEYVFTHGDAVFIVETTDEALATAVVSAMSGAAQPTSPPAS